MDKFGYKFVSKTQIVVNQFVRKMTAKKDSYVWKNGLTSSSGMQEYLKSVLRSMEYKQNTWRKSIQFVFLWFQAMYIKSTPMEFFIRTISPTPSVGKNTIIQKRVTLWGIAAALLVHGRSEKQEEDCWCIPPPIVLLHPFCGAMLVCNCDLCQMRRINLNLSLWRSYLKFSLLQK